jgi:hypothetical protein
VIVEQDIDTAVRAASHAYCFMHGRVSLHGPTDALTKPRISAAYFGLDDDGAGGARDAAVAAPREAAT